MLHRESLLPAHGHGDHSALWAGFKTEGLPPKPTGISAGQSGLPSVPATPWRLARLSNGWTRHKMPQQPSLSLRGAEANRQGTWGTVCLWLKAPFLRCRPDEVSLSHTRLREDASAALQHGPRAPSSLPRPLPGPAGPAGRRGRRTGATGATGRGLSEAAPAVCSVPACASSAGSGARRSRTRGWTCTTGGTASC